MSDEIIIFNVSMNEGSFSTIKAKGNLQALRRYLNSIDYSSESEEKLMKIPNRRLTLDWDISLDEGVKPEILWCRNRTNEDTIAISVKVDRY